VRKIMGVREFSFEFLMSLAASKPFFSGMW
jgi:hypothetical protein